jgi:hypothetical protein
MFTVFQGFLITLITTNLGATCLIIFKQYNNHEKKYFKKSVKMLKAQVQMAKEKELQIRPKFLKLPKKFKFIKIVFLLEKNENFCRCHSAN